jgi:hypothetical protein
MFRWKLLQRDQRGRQRFRDHPFVVPGDSLSWHSAALPSCHLRSKAHCPSPIISGTLVFKARSQQTEHIEPNKGGFKTGGLPRSAANGCPARSDSLLTNHQLEPNAYQRQIGHAGRQQRDGQRRVYALAGGSQDRSHGW